MRLKNIQVITILFVLSGCMLSNAFAQNGDNKPLTDLPRQFAATAFGQAGAMAGFASWETTQNRYLVPSSARQNPNNVPFRGERLVVAAIRTSHAPKTNDCLR